MALREAAADAVCNFGSSLKTLDGREHLTLKVKKPEETRYFTFTMNDVRTCQRGDIDPGELLERSYSY